MGKTKAPHHRGTYHRESAKVRAAAYADAGAICWRCGLTLDQMRAQHPRVRWTAGHLVDGQVNGPLVAEHSNCNYAAGARLGNRRRANRPQPQRTTERTW